MSKAPSTAELEALLPYCQTERQEDILTAVIEHGSGRSAAEALGTGKSTVNDTINRVRKYAASKGWAPNHDMVFTVPDSFNIKRVSTLRNTEGEVTAQWTVAEPEKERQAAELRAYVEALSEDLVPFTPVVTPAPTSVDSDLIGWVNIGDAHLGMLATSAETLSDFDLSIAEQELVKAFSSLIDRLTNVSRIVICDLGDMTHTENTLGVTEASRHSLDVDGGFHRIVKVYTRIMRHIVDLALLKGVPVDIIINQGNHSRTNDIFMAEFLRHVYERETRVTVLDNTNVFIPYRFGNTFILTHHGDKTKMDRMTNVMVSDYRHDMDAKYKYIYTGHIHNNKVLAESHGIVVESFNQLAAGDKYAHEGGWRSRKCMTALLLSRNYGEVGRVMIPVEQVKSLIEPSLSSDFDRQDVFTV